MRVECLSSMRTNLRLKLVLIGAILPVSIAVTAQVQPSAAPGLRNTHMEDVVAVLFEHARIEFGTQPLSRIYRSDVQKLVCTATAVEDGSQAPVQLPLNVLYK